MKTGEKFVRRLIFFNTYFELVGVLALTDVGFRKFAMWDFAGKYLKVEQVREPQS